jgi:hypothetical protein
MIKHYPDFLIIGLERSGTHWISALLNAHPDIACFPSQYWYEESGRNKIGSVHFFDTLASIEGGYKYEKDFDDFSFKYNKKFADLVPLKEKISKEELYEVFLNRYSEYCDEQRGNKKIVGESSTGYVFVLPFIDTLRPDIKKICIVRDPKDRIVSWHFNQIRKGRKKEGDPITEDFATEYLNNRVLLEYECLLKYSAPICLVQYEILHENPTEEVQKILYYLGFSGDRETVNQILKTTSFEKETEREGEKRALGEQNIMSGLRKGVIGDWRNYINTSLAEKIDGTAQLMEKRLFEKYNINR